MTAQITLFPLASLVLAPENARSATDHDPAAIQTLAGSITALGRLIDPLHGYQDGDQVAIWDGGRRLLALKALQTLPAALVDGIPVILTDRADVSLASVATFVREDMHPVDQFLIWNALHLEGQTPDMIAAACGVSPRDVARLLRFQMLAPDVLTAFREGRFDFDVATAFTLTDDHEKQLSVLASFGDKAMNDWRVRQALKEQSVDASDRRARLVGREAYAEAGGRFITDLFSHAEIDEDWADEALLQRLFDAKVAQVLADLEAEGWGAVVQAGDRYGQGWRQGLDAIQGEGEDGAFTPDQMATAMALVVFDYRGDLDIKRGFVKATSAKSGGTTSTVTPPAKADPARYGFGHAGHARLTTVATRATPAALLTRPDVAYDGVVAHLAWVALGRGRYDQHVSTVVAPGSRSSVHADVLAAREDWDARLPDERVAFWTAVADLTADEKAQLLAVAFAGTLEATEDKVTDNRAGRWETLGFMARRAGADMATALTADHEFLKGGSREALLTVIGDPSAANAKKGELVERAKQKIEAGGWVPQLLRDLVEAPPAPKAAPKKGRKGKPVVETPPVDATADTEAA